MTISDRSKTAADRPPRPVPGELALVAACCRWPQSAEAVAEVQRRAADALDWSVVLRLAERHRVVGFVHHALGAAGVTCPPMVAVQLAGKSRAIARRNLALAAEALRLQRRFDEARIPLVTLKGVALAQRAYGMIALKHGRDIDLLVPPDQVVAALRLVETDGYALVDPARVLSDAQRHAFIARGYQMELADGRRELRIELHWRLSENPRLTIGIDAFSNGRAVPLAGGSLRTLDDADLFAYLSAHGANHFWFRLKWLADLDALLGPPGQSDLTALYRHAQACGAGLCAAQALLLCERMFGRALPVGLRAALDRDRRVGRLVRLAVDAAIGGDPAAAPVRDAARQGAALRRRFLLGRGPRFWLAQCAIALTAPADVIRWPLPRPLRFIYPLLRLPSWLLRRL